MKKTGVWVAARILFYGYWFMGILSLGFTFFLFAPLTTYYYFNDLRFWRYIRLYRKFFFITFRIFYKMATERNYGFIFTAPLTGAPLSAPNPDKVKLSSKWTAAVHTCEGCSQCCEKIDCPALDPEKGICLSYNSFFWRYFNCGRYPINQKQIEYYQCPKWKMR